MVVLYRITDWDEHFENNRTRQLKHMDWVPLPNKHDGDGYTELLSHADGAAHFGAWVAIVQVASKCRPRGTLVRSIPHDDAGCPHPPAALVNTPLRPHDSTSLSRITRIPTIVFDSVIPRLLSIGWLTSEVVASSTLTKITHEGAGTTSQSGTRVPDNDYGTEGNGREGKGTDLSAGADVPATIGSDSATLQAAQPAATADAGKAGGTGRKRKQKPTGEERPEHAELRNYFRELWKARNGADYAWKHGRDDAHAKWVLDACGRDVAQVKRIVEAFIDDDDPWVSERGHEISLLVSRFNRYRAKPLAEEGNGFARTPLPPDVADTLILEAHRAATGR